jgi:hypothetical protein
VLQSLGGQEKYIRTQDFFKQEITNLSEGFRINKHFHLEVQDYFKDDTLLESLKSFIETQYLNSENIKYKKLSLEVEKLTDRSIVIWLGIDLPGEMAPIYQVLERTLEKAYLHFISDKKMSVPYPKFFIENRPQELSGL